MLRGTLNSAEARGAFRGVVAKIVPRFRAAYVPRDTYLTPGQFSQLMACIAAPAHEKAKPETVARVEARRVRRMLYCLLIALASPRRGELEKLRWEHVDLLRGTIRVPKGKTKSRVVPIHPILRPWLEALHAGQGAVIEPWTSCWADLKRACARAGVPRVTPNDLRRTFATWLKQRDVDSAVVAAMMGHSSTAMVDRVYGKLDEATYRRAIIAIRAEPGPGVTVRRKSGTDGTSGQTSINPRTKNPSRLREISTRLVRAEGLELQPAD